MNTPETLSYYVPGDDFSKAGEAASNLKRELQKRNISPAVIRKTCIALYEGEINMALYAGGGQVFVEIFDDCITLLLKDNGQGIEDVEKALQQGYSTASDEVRSLGFGAGMGLPNMKHHSDAFEIHSEQGKGTQINIKVYIHPPFAV